MQIFLPLTDPDIDYIPFANGCVLSSRWLETVGEVEGVFRIRRAVGCAVAESLLLESLSFKSWRDLWLLVTIAQQLVDSYLLPSSH